MKQDYISDHIKVKYVHAVCPVLS